MNIRKLAAATAMAAALIGGGMVTAAASASTASPAVVLVNYDGGTIHLGQNLRVGVWYQAFSGGSRAYRVYVYGPAGHQRFYHAGNASTTWQFWNVKTDRIGTWHTKYVTDGKSYTVATKVIR